MGEMKETELEELIEGRGWHGMEDIVKKFDFISLLLASGRTRWFGPWLGMRCRRMKRKEKWGREQLLRRRRRKVVILF